MLPDNIILQKIYTNRGCWVMLDKDLAELYGVETRSLNQVVKRNISRFPDDFMFQLTQEEFADLKSQIVTSSWGGTRKAPYAFTEQGVAMLSKAKVITEARRHREKINDSCDTKNSLCLCASVVCRS